MKRIKLTHGKVAVIDDEDFLKVSKYKWHFSKRGRNCYAETSENLPNGQVTISMHILLMGRIIGFEIDHINHNGLDNRRSNLRHVTCSQNQQNRRPSKNHSSIFKGVSWNKRDKGWRASIQKNKILYYLGTYLKEKDAALAYNKAASEMYGEFCYLNILGNRGKYD